mgnify:CR=1 FL=1|jgi:hypothetical protein|tara:strand:- start:126 stop:428 length:303 start_codon:yes stop_codon:yes gene_type:complete
MKRQNIGKHHQNKIRKQANKNPLEAYFLGGFDLVDDDKQKETKEYINKLSDKAFKKIEPRKFTIEFTTKTNVDVVELDFIKIKKFIEDNVGNITEKIIIK